MLTNSKVPLLRYRTLVTANILYRIPDYKSILQTYIHQDYDLVPDFPNLTKFLQFWHLTLDGPLYKITVSCSEQCEHVELDVRQFLN